MRDDVDLVFGALGYELAIRSSDDPPDDGGSEVGSAHNGPDRDTPPSAA